MLIGRSDSIASSRNQESGVRSQNSDECNEHPHLRWQRSTLNSEFWLLASSFIQPYPQQRQQLLGFDRLGDIIRCARFEALLAVAFHSLGGQGDDRQQFEFAHLADRA